MDKILSIFNTFEIQHLFDILMVSAVFFMIFSLVRESRSSTAMRGLLAVLLGGLFFYLLAQFMNLRATATLLEESRLLIVIVFLIVFQNELKMALNELGEQPIFRPFFRQSQGQLDEVVKACVRMADKRVGALIAIERRTSLKPYIDVGTKMDSQISAELLRTIFSMYTPLHDGAVIIRQNRIAAAGCLLSPADPRTTTGLMGVDLGADGGGGPDLIIPAGAGRMPVARARSPLDGYLQMNGPEVFRFLGNSSGTRSNGALTPGEKRVSYPHKPVILPQPGLLGPVFL